MIMANGEFVVMSNKTYAKLLGYLGKQQYADVAPVIGTLIGDVNECNKNLVVVPRSYEVVEKIDEIHTEESNNEQTNQ